MSFIDNLKAVLNYDLKNLFTDDKPKQLAEEFKKVNKLSRPQVQEIFNKVFENDPEQANYAYGVWSEAEILNDIKDTNKQLDKNIREGQASIANRYISTYVTQTQDQGIYGYSTRDEVIQNNDMASIERSLKDPKVRSALMVLLAPIFSDELIVNQNGEEDNAVELKEYIDCIFSEMKGTMSSKLKEGVKTALAFQNCFFEIVPKWADTTKFAGKRVINSLMSKRVGLLEFLTDDYDNVLGLHSLIHDDEYYDLDRFFILSFNNLFSNPYGETVFASYFKFWKAKLIVYQDMVVYANRYSQPIPSVTYDDDTLAGVAQDISNNLYAGVNIALPEGIKVEFLSALSSGSNNPFTIILDWLDRQISLAICGIDLSQGSYAADKVIQEERALYVQDLRRDIQDLLNEQIVRRFIARNYDIDSYPYDIYPYVTFKEAVKEITINDFMGGVQIADDLGAIDVSNRLADKNKVRTFLGFDEIDADEQEDIEIEDDIDDENEIVNNIDLTDDEEFSFNSFIKNNNAVSN
jgi:hypothetical protein|tara:strand:- start:4703 stop:6268 length:1566 start_codon:yes stop_codon:yes gene_type:complete